MKSLALILAPLLALSAPPALAGKLSPEALAHQLGAYPPQITLLGEVHDNPTHHRTQALAVSALAPKALVFEMLSPEQAARATAQTRRSAPALEAALGWQGWPDFKLYAPIFAAAPEARIYGAALPRAQIKAAMQGGAASVFGAEAAAYGLAQPMPEAEQQAMLTEQVEAHCGQISPAQAGPMVEAQRLRDAAFARVALQALRETGGPVAVIAGTGHTRKDTGMAFYLRWAAPEARVLSVVQLEDGQTPPDLQDLWLTAPAPARPDPCSAFKAP